MTEKGEEPVDLRIAALEKEVAELRSANEILHRVAGFFAAKAGHADGPVPGVSPEDGPVAESR
ncbi:hypothetical protein JOF53_008225 [Crossiella equi]|uniref:Transposase n=1 Tax=Crossiella equi TaxID=130796 RepID=A0ABS5AS03_9PSEU|nr:hypothetical protein [Crossiella equi]MBP2479353.1 hypothetical protein [Crossiella equi]